MPVMVNNMARYQIKEIARKQGMSLKRIAAQGGLSETRLRDLANNRLDNVTVRFLEVVAATTRVPLRDLFDPASLNEVPTLPEKVGAETQLPK